MSQDSRPEGIEVKVDVKPTSGAALAPAAYANSIQVATDSMGMATIYFFTLPPDISNVPGASEQIEAWTKSDQSGAPVLKVELPASAKVVVPQGVLQTLVEVLGRRYSGGGDAH